MTWKSSGFIEKNGGGGGEGGRRFKNKLTCKDNKDRTIKMEMTGQRKGGEMQRRCLVNYVELKTRTIWNVSKEDQKMPCL